MKIAEHLYRLTVPTPFPVGPVNLYLVTEPETILIDTGPATPGALEKVKNFLTESGTDISRLRRIILTHSHQDHCGLATALHRESGATIFGSQREQAQFTGDEGFHRFCQTMMEQGGMPPDVVDKIGEHFKFVRSLGETVPEFEPLESLEAIRCGDTSFHPIWTPGHTPGSMSLWAPGPGILISADTVIKHITPNPFLAPDQNQVHGRFRSLRRYLESLEHIDRLGPVVVHSGHGDPVEDFAAYHQGLSEHHRKRQEATADSLHEGPRTVFEVAQRLFPGIGRFDNFLALSEAYAHLDLLEEEGRITRQYRDAVAIYSLG